MSARKKLVVNSNLIRDIYNYPNSYDEEAFSNYIFTSEKFQDIDLLLTFYEGKRDFSRGEYGRLITIANILKNTWLNLIIIYAKHLFSNIESTETIELNEYINNIEIEDTLIYSLCRYDYLDEMKQLLNDENSKIALMVSILFKSQNCKEYLESQGIQRFKRIESFDSIRYKSKKEREQYGPVKYWDVSNLREMTDLSFISGEDVSRWNVSNVETMFRMFLNCNDFNCDLSKWNVKNVRNMSQMFENCYSFTSDLSKWNVSSVKDMSGMFENCYSFTSDLSNWNVSRVQNMSRMFYGCKIFNSDLSRWNVIFVKDMSYMFFRAKLFSSDLSKWKPKSLNDADFMFFEAYSFNSDLRKWDKNFALRGKYTFYGAKKFDIDRLREEFSKGSFNYFKKYPFIKDIRVNFEMSDNDFEKLYNESEVNPEIFNLLLEFYAGKRDFSKEEYLSLFRQAKNIDLDITHLLGIYTKHNFPEIDININIEIEDEILFTLCRYDYLEEMKLYLDDYSCKLALMVSICFNSTNCIRYLRENGVEEFEQISNHNIQKKVDFWKEKQEESLAKDGDIKYWDVSRVTYMRELFRDCWNVNPDISRWNVSNVTNMNYMFDHASIFNSDLSKWNVGKVTHMNSMFSYAEKFNSDISQWNVSNVVDMEKMFTGAIRFNSDISNWDVSNVVTMRGMFFGATEFNSDVSKWNVSKVDVIEQMFDRATNFNRDLSGWNLENIKNKRNIFG